MKLEEISKEIEKKKKYEDQDIPIVFKQERGRKRRRIVWLLLLCLLCLSALGVTFIPRILNGGNEETKAAMVEAAIMDGYPEGVTQEDLVAAIQEEMDDSMFKITQQARAVFENGSAKGSVNIINGEGNKLPAMVSITLTEDETVLYQSGELLWPGKYIPDIRLAKKLEKGTHDAMVTYRVYDEAGEKEQGVMSANMEIVIQN